MELILITEKDAANVSLLKIAKAFIRNGHIVKIYAPFYEEKMIQNFDENIEIYTLTMLSKNEIDSCDLIFTSTLASIYLPEFVFSAHKPIFTHNYLMNRQINWGGDICFAPSVVTVSSDYDEFLNYSYVGIGEPKYDNQEMLLKYNKRFLFIDSGHYPFSLEGKNALARLLLGICINYPEYELWIKPRFLPDDRVVTHRNDMHLYDVIYSEANGRIPNNMIMLDYHEDLKKLINQSDTVICMYTTAFVGAVVAGKGLIVLDNLPTTDVYDIRHKTYMRNRENIIPSGALIDYRDVDQVLPNGVKTSSEYLDFLLEEKENVANKICEVCEYLYNNFYSQNKFPCKCNSTYKGYKYDFIEDEEMSWERLLSQRYFDYMMLKSLILIDFHIKSKLDISIVLNGIESIKDSHGIISTDAFKAFLSNVNDFRDRCIISNRKVLLQDEIDAGILLNSYYLQQQFDEIREFPITSIGAFSMYRAFVAVETNELNGKLIAKKHLKKYFEKSIQRRYNLEISDMSNNKFKAFRILIDLLIEDKEIELVNYYIEELVKFYKKIYFSDINLVPQETIQRNRYEYIRYVKAVLDGEKNE